MPYEKARKELNFYTTTIHVINSCIVKMGKLTKAQPVYRGMSGRIFPEQFWKPNSQGVMGGVEFAFMSTTPDRSVAEQYSQDGFGIIVEIQQGMIDRGAEISWLSQYPHEVEVLFAPLAGLEAREMRIDTHPLNGKHIIIVSMRISINLTNPTIEQVVAKRKKIVGDMGRGLLMEMRGYLNKKGSNETEGYIKLMEGMMAERPLSHEATWYNDDPSFQESVNETLRLKREVLNVPTLEARKLEGDAVAQLLGETIATKSKVLEVPETLFVMMKQLRTLNIDGFGGIEHLPKSIGALASLHTLHLRECESLLELPEATFGKLLNLQTLNLTSCKSLGVLTPEIGKLINLIWLDLSFCEKLKALPTEIGKLSRLDSFKLQKCTGLTELPASIGKLQSLRILNMYGCSTLIQLPEPIGELQNLEELNLRSCGGLTTLPNGFGERLPNLTSLDLSMCKILSAIPDSLGQCAALETLFMGNCLGVPFDAAQCASITRLKNLHTLNLYNLRLDHLPARQLQLLGGAEGPIITGCEKLKEVPPSLAQAPALTTLTLWNCNALEIMPDLSAYTKAPDRRLPRAARRLGGRAEAKARGGRGGGAQHGNHHQGADGRRPGGRRRRRRCWAWGRSRRRCSRRNPVVDDLEERGQEREERDEGSRQRRGPMCRLRRGRDGVLGELLC